MTNTGPLSEPVPSIQLVGVFAIVNAIEVVAASAASTAPPPVIAPMVQPELAADDTLAPRYGVGPARSPLLVVTDDVQEFEVPRPLTLVVRFNVAIDLLQ